MSFLILVYKLRLRIIGLLTLLNNLPSSGLASFNINNDQNVKKNIISHTSLHLPSSHLSSSSFIFTTSVSSSSSSLLSLPLLSPSTLTLNRDHKIKRLGYYF